MRIARIRERRGAYWVLVGKPEGRRQLGIPRIRREDDIKMDVREVEWRYVLDRYGSGYGLVAGFCESGDKSCGCLQRGEFFD